ncbi:MAG: dUTP diphosphatase [Planktomarina sp.]|nr:dUTP diphosphatase [Planktomarina sp.]|tara:strand:- start:4836 stop:5294 length:459 start_codon:yes stop_codon:yes gene_type:complete
MKPLIEFVWEDGADQSLGLPKYATPGAAGADLRANIKNRSDMIMEAGTRALISTGLHLAIAKGFEVQIRPRSGLALKHGITLANAPGTIDCDYRGPLGVILLNVSSDAFTVSHGDRIAQMVVSSAVQAEFLWVNSLSTTTRGDGGFGSTGQK